MISLETILPIKAIDNIIDPVDVLFSISTDNPVKCCGQPLSPEVIKAIMHIIITVLILYSFKLSFSAVSVSLVPYGLYPMVSGLSENLNIIEGSRNIKVNMLTTK